MTRFEGNFWILPVYKDAIKISTKAESTTLYNTLIELGHIDFGSFNQIQSVSMNFTEKQEIHLLGDYLSPINFKSKHCEHNIIIENHFTVFEIIMQGLYHDWVPKYQEQYKKYNLHQNQKY